MGRGLLFLEVSWKHLYTLLGHRWCGWSREWRNPTLSIWRTVELPAWWSKDIARSFRKWQAAAALLAGASQAVWQIFATSSSSLTTFATQSIPKQCRVKTLLYLRGDNTHLHSVCILWEAWVSVVRPGQIWNPRRCPGVLKMSQISQVLQDPSSPCSESSEFSESYILGPCATHWVSVHIRSRVCLLASWLNRFSSLVMPTLRRASADSRVTAVRCTRCVRPAVANYYTH